jgi:hypothetical protein
VRAFCPAVLMHIRNCAMTVPYCQH